MSNLESLASMSGEKTYKTVPLPVFDEITLNGNDGEYFERLKTAPKIKEKDELGAEREVFEKKPLGKSIEYVWLKLRRQLVERNNDGVVRQTSEHNTKKDFVSIYHYNGQATEDNILASTINGEDGLYPKMKVNQVVYALDLESQKIVKIIIKGSSLSMQEKLEDATLFYQYISAMEKDEHFYTMTNVMTAKPYRTKLGIKQFSNFSKGRALTEEELALVTEKMTIVHTALTAYDEAKAADRVVPGKKAVDDDLDTIDYGDTGVNLDDIPF